MASGPFDTGIGCEVPAKTSRNPRGELAVSSSTMIAHPSVRRWKVLCGVLAALVAYSWVRTPAPFAAPGAPMAARAFKGPMRLGAQALGVSPRELVEQLLSSRDLAEMHGIAERLAMVGGNDAIDALMPLVSDPREGVPALVIDTFGRIATDHAVDLLITLTKDNRSHVATSAIFALGETASPKAELILIEIVQRTGSHEAIRSLAKFTTPAAIAVIAQVAETGNEETQRVAFEVLAETHTPEVQEALRGMIDSPSVLIAQRAMESLQDVDDETLAKLVTIVEAGDSELGPSAIRAIGRAGEAGGVILADIALHGMADLRKEAVRALGGVHTPLAFETLAKIVESEEGEIAEVALAAIAQSDTPEARELLISVAMADGPLADDAITELAAMNGPDVDAALLVIAKSDSATAVSALSVLLGRDHAEAMVLVVARARSGDDERKFGAFELLAHAGTQSALTTLIELVRSEHGPLKVRAIILLATDKRGDPQVGEMLRDSLRAKDPEEAIAAANALAGAGTEEARNALVATLSTTDEGLLYASVRALDSYRLDDSTAAALAQAGERNPSVAPLVMRKLIAGGSPHGVRLAETAINSEDTNVAMRAVESLREIGSKASLKIIENAVHTTEGDVRSVAVRALGDSRDPRVVEIITSALDDNSPGVRESVASALRSVGGDKARSALIGMTRSSDADDRVAALQNLREETDRSAQLRIKEMMRDPDSRVQQYAIYAMAGNAVGIGELRRVVLDAGTPYQLRYDSALALQRYSELDERTSEWLASATEANDDDAYIYSGY